MVSKRTWHSRVRLLHRGERYSNSYLSRPASSSARRARRGGGPVRPTKRVPGRRTGPRDECQEADDERAEIVSNLKVMMGKPVVAGHWQWDCSPRGHGPAELPVSSPLRVRAASTTRAR